METENANMFMEFVGQRIATRSTVLNGGEFCQFACAKRAGLL